MIGFPLSAIPMAYLTNSSSSEVSTVEWQSISTDLLARRLRVSNSTFEYWVAVSHMKLLSSA